MYLLGYSGPALALKWFTSNETSIHSSLLNRNFRHSFYERACTKILRPHYARIESLVIISFLETALHISKVEVRVQYIIVIGKVTTNYI